MQALGLIETKGLIAAIESADAMLKSANVELLEKVCVGGGLVSVAVIGNVGAVNAAVEAGVAAVKKLSENSLVSQHVIPRPNKEIKAMIVQQEEQKEKTGKIRKEEKKAGTKDPVVEDEKQKELETIEVESEQTKTEETKKEETKKDKPKENTIISKELDHSKLNNKESVDKSMVEHGIDKTIEALKKVTVARLRKLTREYTDFGIKRGKISKANKSLLIGEIKKHYEKKELN